VDIWNSYRRKNTAQMFWLPYVVSDPLTKSNSHTFTLQEQFITEHARKRINCVTILASFFFRL